MKILLNMVNNILLIDYSNDIYGEFQPECYDPHFFYGKVLVELGMIKNDVLDLALQRNEKIGNY